MNRISRNIQRLPQLSLVFIMAWAIALAGCDSGNQEQQKAQQAEELNKLRAENEQVKKLRAENKELPRLRADKDELPKLKEAASEMEKLRADNDRIKGEIAALSKSRAERLQAAQQARQAAAAAVAGKTGVIATNLEDPNIPREGDEIMIEPRLLAKLLPQFDWSKLERKEPIAVRALLEQQGIVLTNYQQLIALGVTNYVIQHGPKPPTTAPVPQ